jgi:hypothetical protein
MAKANLHHWRDFVYSFEGALLVWFNAQDVKRIQDFSLLMDQQIDEIKYLDGELEAIAPLSHRVLFKAAVGYIHYVRYHHKYDINDIAASTDIINQESFD